jgi:hypothetical protein
MLNAPNGKLDQTEVMIHRTQHHSVPDEQAQVSENTVRIRWAVQSTRVRRR